MIFNSPHLVTELEIWQPRYSSAYTETNERVALLAKYKVDHATTWIRVTFTKAKHLQGQRYCIKRDDVTRCPIDSNGKIPCYCVPMSKLENWDSSKEVLKIIEEIF